MRIKKSPASFIRAIGQESVPVAVSRHLRATDTVALTHRGHGQALAKGVDLTGFFAEMMGRATGICRGRGGSMHIADNTIGMLGANGIVGGGISIATNSALAHKLADDGNIAVCYIGDGALAEGIFHEYLNLARQILGGMGYACEYHLERLWRDQRLFRFAPVSEGMIRHFMAQHKLKMPRSY